MIVEYADQVGAVKVEADSIEIGAGLECAAKLRDVVHGRWRPSTPAQVPAAAPADTCATTCGCKPAAAPASLNMTPPTVWEGGAALWHTIFEDWKKAHQQHHGATVPAEGTEITVRMTYSGGYWRSHLEENRHVPAPAPTPWFSTPPAAPKVPAPAATAPAVKPKLATMADLFGGKIPTLTESLEQLRRLAAEQGPPACFIANPHLQAKPAPAPAPEQEKVRGRNQRTDTKMAMLALLTTHYKSWRRGEFVEVELPTGAIAVQVTETYDEWFKHLPKAPADSTRPDPHGSWMKIYDLAAHRTAARTSTRSLDEELKVAQEDVANLKVALEEARTERDDAYTDRTQVLALLATYYPTSAQVAYSDVLHPDWPVLTFDLQFQDKAKNATWYGGREPVPGTQVSWHIAQRDLPLLPNLPWAGPQHGRPMAKWDGHTREQKNKRLATEAARVAAEHVNLERFRYMADEVRRAEKRATDASFDASEAKSNLVAALDLLTAHYPSKLYVTSGSPTYPYGGIVRLEVPADSTDPTACGYNRHACIELPTSAGHFKHLSTATEAADGKPTAAAESRQYLKDHAANLRALARAQK